MELLMSKKMVYGKSEKLGLILGLRGSGTRAVNNPKIEKFGFFLFPSSSKFSTSTTGLQIVTGNYP